MPATFTERNRVEKTQPGEAQDTWGQILNDALDRIDESLDGHIEIDCSAGGTITLTASNNTPDQSRPRVLKFTGTLPSATIVEPPAVQKVYNVENATSGAFTLTFRPAGGSGIVLAQGSIYQVFTDGASMFLLGLPVVAADGKLGANIDLNGKELTNGSKVELNRTDTNAAIDLESTNNSGAATALLRLKRNRSTPAAGLLNSLLIGVGDDAAGSDFTFSQIKTRANTITTGSENGGIDFFAAKAGNPDYNPLSIDEEGIKDENDALIKALQSNQLPAIPVSGLNLAEFVPPGNGIRANASRIEIEFHNLIHGDAGARAFWLQVGTSAGYVTANYFNTTSRLRGLTNDSNGSKTATEWTIVDFLSANEPVDGTIVLRRLQGSNTWLLRSISGIPDSSMSIIVSGSIVLPGLMDRLKLFVDGGVLYTGGTVSCTVE